MHRMFKNLWIVSEISKLNFLLVTAKMQFRDNSSCVDSETVYLIILFNLIIPTLLSLVGDPLSGNRCGSQNHL
jgi:hypothetical protein